MKNKIFISILVAAVFFAGSFSNHFLPYELSPNAWAAENAKASLPLRQLNEIAEVYAMVRENYVEDVEPEKLMENAIRGMVSSLDPHSSYLSEKDLVGFRKNLTNEEYGGVGIYVGVKDGWIQVIAPIYGTPAARADMRSGDLIVKINGQSTQDMKVEEAVDVMRGKVDTILKLDVLPVGGDRSNIRQVELVRENITAPSVISDLIDDGYGYLRVTRFQNKTIEDFVTNVNGLFDESETPLKGIILDLRNNPGGYLHAGIGIAAAFLPSGETVVSDKGRKQTEKIFTAQNTQTPNLNNRKTLREIPLVVLVNEGSASASEIVAGALQDHRRAVVLGTRTYGKASVQSIFQLPSSKGQTGLRLTIARYFTPQGRNIQGVGITPDITVRQADKVNEKSAEGFTLRESDLPGRLDNDSVDEENKATDAAGKRPKFIEENDFQYDQALLALKALSITASR